MQWYPISNTGMESIEDSTARLNIWDGAVRSSKTICSIIRWIEFVATAPEGPLLMAGKTERTLRRNILDPMAEILGKKRFKANWGNGEVWICGRLIYIVGANDERSEGKIRGMTLAGAYGDELTLWPQAFFKMLLSRLSVKDAKFFGTTNPDSPYHWLKKEYLDREKELNLKRFHFLLEDNLSLDPQYVSDLKKEYRGLWFKRFIQGLWVVAEGAIYDMFDEDLHTVDTLPEIVKYWCAIDYGSASVTTYLLIGKGIDGNYYVVDEWRYDARTTGRQKINSDLSLELREFLVNYGVEPDTIVVDPAAQTFITQLISDGFNYVIGANNDVLGGIQLVSRALGTNRLFIHKRCVGLITEIMGYVWDAKRQDSGEDAPTKKDDHGPDALRYFFNLIEDAAEMVTWTGHR